MNPQIAFLILFLLVYGSVHGGGTAYQPQIGNFTSSQSFVPPDKIFCLGCIINDEDGKESFVNATIELSEGTILLWRNETDTFSMVQNLNNYARLESGSLSQVENSTAYRLHFRLSYRVNTTNGPVSVLATVYDNSSLCGYGNHTDLFVFGPAPEGWQTSPSDIPQSGRALKPDEAVIILVVSLIVIAILSFFASKRKKTTKEKYEKLIDVKTKRRNE